MVPLRMRLVTRAVSVLACQKMCHIDLAVGIHLTCKCLKHRSQVRLHCLQPHLTHTFNVALRRDTNHFMRRTAGHIDTGELLTGGTTVHSAHCGMLLALLISSATMSCKQLCRYPGKSGMT